MMKQKKVLILGGEGNGAIIANAILHANRMGYDEWVFEGFLNDRVPVGDCVEVFPVVGTLQDVKKFLDEGYYFINTILRIDGQRERLELFASLQIPDSQLATFIHPMAYIAPNATIGPGCVVMPLASISSNTTLGRGCLVLSAATVGHDNILGDFCHIAEQAAVGACLRIGVGAHVGLNASVREYVTIGDYSTVGMGSVLTKDIGEQEVWVGNPAKFLRRAE